MKTKITQALTNLNNAIKAMEIAEAQFREAQKHIDDIIKESRKPELKLIVGDKKND